MDKYVHRNKPVSYTHLDVYKRQVLDRTKEPGSLGEPLFLDVATTLREAGMNDIKLVGSFVRSNTRCV